MALRTETRTVSDFERVELRYSGEIFITQGAEVSLSVEADEDILAKLKTEVRGDTLVLEVEGDWLERFMSGLFSLGRGPITYRLTVKSLRGLKISGQGKVVAPELRTERLDITSSGLGRIDIGLTAERLSVNVSGRAELSLRGSVTEQSLFISGSGEYHARELRSERASVKISGHGNATVAVSKALDVSISGYGRVDYAGEPSVSQSITGAGRVERLT
jgi:hypothetical protein